MERRTQLEQQKEEFTKKVNAMRYLFSCDEMDG
jgi:hypothetical protein